MPCRFKDYIAIPKINGYQSLHTTLIGPFGTNIEFQMRTEPMHVVAESGVAAHWLYKASQPQSEASQRLGSQWLQSLLDIQHETRDAAEFWDHVKIDLFPDAVYVFTPKSQIMAMPRGATVVDFAYAIHSRVGERVVSARINNETKPLRTELKNGDVVEVGTEPDAQPDPAWLGFVRTGRARSKIRQHLKTLAQSESQALGEQLLTQALRSEGFEALPSGTPSRPLWDKLLRFSGNKSRAELLTDIGIGKRLATMVAKRFVPILVESGQRPDALLLSRERFAQGSGGALGMITLDGGENASVQFASCCRPVPGDAITGYMGRGEGLIIHTRGCAVSRKLAQKDGERFSEVEWADEPVRQFEIGLGLTVNNVSGVLGKVAAALTAAGADIVHIDMGDNSALDAKDMRLVIAVRDTGHWDAVLRSLRRAPWVMHARRLGHAEA
jgi:GTP pyrophosphokinase